MEIVVADGVNDLLKGANPDICLAYSLDWTFDAIDQDSVSDEAYLQDYARRIGLDCLLTTEVLHLADEEARIAFTLYDLEAGLSEAFEENFIFSESTSFLNVVARTVLERVSVAFEFLSEVDVPPSFAWRDYGRARSLHLRGRTHLAIEPYRSALDLDPEHDFLMTHLADALIDRGFEKRIKGCFPEDDYLEAYTLLQQVLDKDSLNPVAWFLQGKLSVQTERWNQAERCLARSAALDEDNPSVWFYLSRLHPSRLKPLRYGSRETLLKRALALHPGYERAWIDLGDTYYYKSKTEKAQQAYAEVLRIHPTSLDGLLAMGKLYTFRNDVLNIIRVYERVLEIQPDHDDAYYNLGIAYYNDGKIEEAIQFFKEAIALENHADSHFYLGVIYAELGDIDRAIASFRARIALRQGAEDVFAEEARKSLQELLKQKQDNTP